MDKTEYSASVKRSSDYTDEKRKRKKYWRIKGILLLILAVSLTSCSIGFVIGRIVTTDHYSGYIVDTINLSLEDKETGEVATAIYFNLSGRVLYSDGTPYANSMVELRSEPRYTYTDSLGYFLFNNVEPGKHVVNVIQNGVITASCNIDVDADESYTDSQIVQLDDGSFSIHISLDVSVLELTLVLDNDRMIPQLNVDSSTQEEDSNFPENSDQPKPPEQPDIPTTPELPEPPTTPKTPTIPQTPEAPDKAPATEVTEQTGSVKNWSQLTTVNIFGEREGNKNIRTINGQNVISPGASGSYLFRVKNMEDYAIDYSISLLDIDENQPALPLRYRLKAGNNYVGSNQWQNAEELLAETKTLNPGASIYYTLEWKWETVDDITDTKIGMQDGNPLYILTIQINAQFK